MDTTRAKSAADTLARAVQNVASTINTTDTPDTQPTEARPRAAAAPLLLRLEHSVRFFHDELPALQPRLGASVEVHRHPTAEPQRVWLSAAVWQGIATIVRQTPDWHRGDVAAFLEAVRGSMGTTAPMYALLGEVIAEVRRDPYVGIPESDRDDFDTVY